jgi:serine/threonine-protein kinase
MHYFVAPRLPVPAVEVPPLVGLSPEQARGLLEPRALLLILDGERDDDRLAAGTLAEQRPLAGSRVRRGSEVRAQLARASAPRHVPQLAGLTVDTARQALQHEGLLLGKTSDVPWDTPPGTVVAAKPPFGAEVKAGGSVDVTVSSGAATVEVPSVVGKRLSAAKGLLEKAGFAVGGTKYGSADDYEQGVVISQNPHAGTQVSPGVKIDLVIND